jgi:hypothetical protein
MLGEPVSLVPDIRADFSKVGFIVDCGNSINVKMLLPIFSTNRRPDSLKKGWILNLDFKGRFKWKKLWNSFQYLDKSPLSRNNDLRNNILINGSQ